VETFGDGGLIRRLDAPIAAYADVAARAPDDVWFAGGRNPTEDHTRSWPAGEGVLVHYDGKAYRTTRTPSPLLAVAAVGPGEAWAAGVDGVVVHVKDGRAEAFATGASDLLRGVWAAGPSDVFVVGDGPAILHWDGQTLRRVDASAMGPDTALVGVAGDGRGKVLAVGPAGIVAIERTAR
jgi:hypothetical protein